MTSSTKSGWKRILTGPLGLVLVLLVLLGGLYGALQYIVNGGRALDFLAPREAPAPRQTTLEGMGWGVALVKCEDAVRTQLKDPQSAQFPSSGEPMWNGQAWNHAGEVRASNGFGAMVQTSYVCQITGTTQSDAVTKAQLLQ